jgi:hypothetical protein
MTNGRPYRGAHSSRSLGTALFELQSTTRSWAPARMSSEQSDTIIQEPRHEIPSTIIQLAQANAISAVMGSFARSQGATLEHWSAGPPPVWLSLGNSDLCGAKPDSHKGPRSYGQSAGQRWSLIVRISQCLTWALVDAISPFEANVDHRNALEGQRSAPDSMDTGAR